MRRLFLSVLGGGLLLFAATALADVATVTFSDPNSPPDGISCGQPWTESGVGLRFEPITDDCNPGACVFSRARNVPGNVYLAPSRLVIDAATVAGSIVSVEADIQDFCGLGCTRLLLYDGATPVASVGNATLGTLETLRVQANGSAITHAVISSCSGVCFEVRVTHESAVPAPRLTWGEVKARFD